MKLLRISLIVFFAVLLAAATVVLSQSEQNAGPASTYSGAPCAEHGIADSLCTRCHPELAAAFKQKGDWCLEHRLPESQDDLCHPELAKKFGTISVGTAENSAASASPAAADWCSAHRVPESECTKCNPSLVEAFKAKGDWCKPHGIPESHCYQCNPDLSFAQDPKQRTGKAEVATPAAADWCVEHRVPESQCTKCHPELAAKFKADGDWCGAHGIPESHCYRCNLGLKFPQEADYLKQKSKLKEESGLTPAGQPETALYRTNAAACATDQAVVQLTSIESARRAGLLVEEVQAASLSETINAPAEVEFDATASYAVTSLVGGTLINWLVQPGESVRQGQTLAYMQSIDGATLKAEFGQAQALLNLSKNAHDRAQALSKAGLNSAREAQEAEADYLRAQAEFRKSEGALRALGLTDDDLRQLADGDGSSALLPLNAGQSGTLVDQRVALGSVLSAGESIGLIASTEKLWIEAQVRDRDLARVKVGQPVVVSSDGQGVNRCSGTVTWVSDQVDPLSRMGKVRIETRPNGNALKAHQFVHVQVSVGTSSAAVIVPPSAVQWEGCCNVVFVSETRDRFRPRKITVAFVDDQGYVVTGLQPGEKIVTHGSYLLKTELMKGSIGAGCCGTGA
ncbi:efflux RND transporter periplasmic adaptor subunit [candidate division KSB1 bacterium]|nr:efflux RND transporter periplasmic adaptor subunit [candidate division KSB1 bacterium]